MAAGTESDIDRSRTTYGHRSIADAPWHLRVFSDCSRTNLGVVSELLRRNYGVDCI